MPLFRKKPVVIEAVQFTGENHDEVLDFMYTELPEGGVLRTYAQAEGPWGPSHIIIDTLEGEMRADPGDWIIRGVKGELYPCKPDIFEDTYDPEGS